jgi:hypothetical protein
VVREEITRPPYYFEWIGAGTCHADERSGSMHGKKFLVKEGISAATAPISICAWISIRAVSGS